MITLTKQSDTLVDSGLVLPRVNLLPPEIAQQRRSRQTQGWLAGGVLAAVGVVAVLYGVAASDVSGARHDLEAAQAQQSSLQAQTARYGSVTATYRRAAQAQAMLSTAMGEEVRYSRFFGDLARSVPDGVWLKSATWTQGGAAAAGTAATTTPTASTSTGSTATPAAGALGTIALSGVAFDHTDVAAWLDALAAQDGYTQPLLDSATTTTLGTRKVVNWSTTVTLSPQALSHRYTPSGG